MDTLRQVEEQIIYIINLDNVLFEALVVTLPFLWQLASTTASQCPCSLLSVPSLVAAACLLLE